MQTLRAFLCFLMLMSLHFNAFAQTCGPVIRGPYLQINTPESVIVKWRTSGQEESTVYFGASPAVLTQTASSNSNAKDHEVLIANLSPNTKYYYSVGNTNAPFCDGNENQFFVTAPSTGTKTPFKVWVLGDSGTADERPTAVRDAYYNYIGHETPDFIMMLGDNAYSDGTDKEYQDAMFENMYEKLLVNTPVWSTPGNHDLRKDMDSPYFDIFALPSKGEAGGVPSGTEAYYSYDFHNVHFICLDSQFSDADEPDTPMYEWLREDLASTNQDWIIAFWHHPPYSKGSHDSDTEGSLADMRNFALPILEAGGVDMVLSGHSHSYERSFLLNGHYEVSSKLESSMVLDSGNGQVDSNGAYTKTTTGVNAGKGAVYIVAGSSGKVSTKGDMDHPVMYSSLEELGSLSMEFDNDQLLVKFINDKEEIRDYFTLIKSLSDKPFFTSNPITSIGVGENYVYSPAFENPNASQIGMVAAQLPSWLTFSGNVLVGTPQSAQTGSHTVELHLRDAQGIVCATQLFTIQVGEPIELSIAPIDQQMSDEDSMFGPIEISITADDFTKVTLTASSDKQEVMNNANIRIVPGSSSDRYLLTANPKANANGDINITLTLNEAENSVSTSFPLLIRPINDAPVISTIADQSADKAVIINPINFTVNDIETAPDALNIRFESSNPTIVDASGIVLTGDGESKALSIQSKDQLAGNSIITVILSDESLESRTTFNVNFTEAGNNAPRITVISDQVASPGDVISGIPFSISDIETPANELRIEVNSSDQSILKNSNIKISGSGEQRTMELKTENQAGLATVSVKVSDGVNVSVKPFSLLLSSGGNAPVVSTIPNKTTNEDEAVPAFGIQVIDSDTPWDQLKVKLISSNKVLFPQDMISAIFRQDGILEVSMMPFLNQHGTSNFELTVSDGKHTTVKTFVVKVLPVNDLPEITAIEDITIYQDSTLGPISIEVYDVETGSISILMEAFSSDQSVMPDNSLFITGDGFDKQLSFQLNTTELGSTIVTVVADDGEESTSISFTINIIARDGKLSFKYTKVITPNADGHNDFLKIDDKALADHNIQIFNRGGLEVYAADQYANDWDATHFGKPLAEGTYYLVIRDQQRRIKGTGPITVLR